jgi:hypothetical protein
MRFAGAVAALLSLTVDLRASADELPSSPSPSPAAAAYDDAPLRAELARQAAAIEELRAALAARGQPSEPKEVPRAVVVSGFAQVDWIVHNQISQNEINGSTGQPLNQDRFTLRRGHLRVDAQKGLVSGALEIDANTTNGPQVRPIAAEVSLRWPETRDPRLPSIVATAGLTRIPFGFEVQELDYVRPFLERATVLQALFPGEFDLGAKIVTRYRFVELALGVMNGNPIGNRQFPALDPAHEKDMVGRLGVDLELFSGVRLKAGVSAETGTGFHSGTPQTKDVLVWQDQNGDGLVEPNEITVIGGTPATPSRTFQRFAIGGDARITAQLPVVGELALRAEVVRAQNLDRGLEVADPVGAGRDLREIGWSVGATQEITKWGEIGVRYDRYNPDDDASRQRAFDVVPQDRSYSTLAVMGMVRYETARLLIEYDVNGNALGTGTSGAPTTLADNVLTLRAQVVF